MGMDISGLTGGGSASLNDDMLTKLRAEDEKVTVKPAEKRIEDWQKGSDSYDLVKAQFTTFQDAMYPFTQGNLNNNVFDAVSTSVQGDSVLYDAVGSLEEGTSNITVNQLATRDVWQSDNTVSSTDDLVGAGDFKITIDGTEHKFTTTDTTTYSELATMINNDKSFDASVSQVGDDSFRMVVKSIGTGDESKMTFDEDLSGIDWDATTSHVQTAQNLKATIDGVAYETSSNTIKVNDSLSMTAVKTGDSSINIQSDPNAVVDAVNTFVEAFNALTDTINNESRYNAETEEAGSLQNSSQIRNILSSVKEKMFGSYGDDVGDKHNVFGFGFELDRYGKLSVDQDILADKVSNSPADLKELFTGTPENKGLLEDLHTYIDNLDTSNGVLGLYEKNMASDKTSLEEAKDKAIADLDSKYQRMKTQFSRYSVIISQMESSFSSLKYQIAESTASK
jgi:flagellar hook-associated protein 2